MGLLSLHSPLYTIEVESSKKNIFSLAHKYVQKPFGGGGGEGSTVFLRVVCIANVRETKY